MDNDDVIFLCEIDDLSEKFEPVQHRRRRVMRKVDDKDLRPRPCLLESLFQFGEKVDPGPIGMLETSPPAIITAYGCIGYAGVGDRTTSPGWTMARARCESPSLDPIVTTASVSGLSLHRSGACTTQLLPL